MLAAMDTMDERTKIRATEEEEEEEEIMVSSSSTKRRKVDDSDELLILNLVENSASASTANSTMSSSSSSFFVEELSDMNIENMRSTDLKVKLKFKILLHRRLFRLRKSENFNAP